jgi:hypothetical protein
VRSGLESFVVEVVLEVSRRHFRTGEGEDRFLVNKEVEDKGYEPPLKKRVLLPLVFGEEEKE